MRKFLPIVLVLIGAGMLSAQSGPFDKPVTGDLQILHALERLTFGPRPGDIDAVKQIGLRQWIDLQLHPDRIPANEALEALTAPFVEPSPSVAKLAPGLVVATEDLSRLNNGTAKEDLDFLNSLPRGQIVPALMAMPVVRTRILSMLDPDLRAQLNDALSTEEFQRQSSAAAVFRELVTPDQMQTLHTGTTKDGLDLLASLPLDRAAHVLIALPIARVRLISEVSPELRAKVEAGLGSQEMYPKPTMPAMLKPRLQLTQEQLTILQSGSDQEASDFFAMLPEEDTVQVLAAQPPATRIHLLRLLDPALRKRVETASPVSVKPGGFIAQAKLLRAIQSDRQLEEVLTDFWYNHFNVDASKGAAQYLVSSYERESIRPRVLGKFRDLLEATAVSPAMLFYLDNWQSSALGLNENYARELMELHTLGVDGGYTQHDIVEVARCFTGWTIDNPSVAAPFVYRDELHDQGAKTVLGVTIPAGGGQKDGEKVLDILARHPSTARFISRELAERFVADDPPPALIDRMAKTFRDSDGDIRAVLAALFDSPEFFSEGAYQAKLKTPFEMIVSAVRATGAQVVKPTLLVNQTSALGQPLYLKLEPTGYSNVGADWASSSGLMSRMNLALDLAENKVSGVELDSAKFSAVPATAARQLEFTGVRQQTLDAITKSLEGDSSSGGALVAGMLLGSPDFQRR